jgi:hypothetical protein
MSGLSVEYFSWQQIVHMTPEQGEWLWHGYVAPGAMTLLAGQWKAGKTTLLSALLSRLKAGGELAGQSVRPGRVLVITEEGPTYWRERGPANDFDGHVQWIFRPFIATPTRDQWEQLIDEAARRRERHPYDLLVIDPLAMVLPRHAENHVATAMDALAPLRRLADRGPAVFILHHTGKRAKPGDGRAARGSSALTSHVDVVMELHWYNRAADNDRRRKLLAWSRRAGTPRQQVIEWNADCRDYAALGDFAAEAGTANENLLELVLVRASGTLTRQEILEYWPENFPKPDIKSLWEWLGRGVRDGRILRAGAGHKGDPYRYWLPESQQRWRADPFNLELPPLDNGLADEITPEYQAHLDKQAQRAAELLQLAESKQRGRKG